MDAGRYARVKELLLRARELSEPEREPFIRESAGGDQELVHEVLVLLSQEGRPARIVEEGVVPSAVAVSGGHPERVGPYRIAGVLGEGGMGVVYRAVQEEPIRREVALKLVRRGMDSESVLRRFQWERQSLARMHHPHIATVLDAGTDDHGHPWFVMPLVEGRPITRFCDEERLGVAERLELFGEVCRAVQHAHQRGVLHRDLKPGNVLVRRVGNRPVPTVIDFGIAKALSPGDEEHSAGLTLEGQRIGTPAYMSPEQLHGEEAAVDTRSDVYALGVILYELLAGSHPWAETGDTAPTVATDRTAPSPSDAITQEDSATRARERSTSPRELRRLLRGDLDTICLMAVRSEPERRYASAAHLAEDLERYRRGQPVSARPDSWRYRAGKFARRHPAGISAAALALLLVVVSGIFLVWHAGQLEVERDRALVAEERARNEALAATSISEFLEDIFVLAQPGQGGPADLSATELLRQGVERVPDELEDQPYLQARMLGALGRVHHSLSLLAEAESLIVAGLDIIENETVRSPRDRRLERGRLRQLLATIIHDRGRPLEATAWDSLAIEDFRAIGPEGRADLAMSLNSLGINLQAGGRLDEAVGPIQRSLEMQEAMSVDDAAAEVEVAWGWGTLGYLNYKRGDLAAAEEQFVHSLEMARRLFADQDHFDLAHALNNYGGVLTHLDRLDEAEVVLQEALEMCERMYAQQEHAALGRAVSNRALVDRWQGEAVRALEGFERAHGIMARTLGESHPRTASALEKMAEIQTDLGRVEEAKVLIERADAYRRATLPPDHPERIGTDLVWGRVLVAAGEVEEALPRLRRYRAWCAEQYGAGHFRRGEADATYGEALLAAERRSEALPILQQALADLRAAYGPEHREVRDLVAHLDRASEDGGVVR